MHQLERGRSRTRSPEKAAGGQCPTSRSPSPLTGNKENKDQPTKSNFPARRFDQSQGRMHRHLQGHFVAQGLRIKTKIGVRIYRVVEDKVVGLVENWGVIDCSIDRTMRRHPVRHAHSLLSITLNPVEGAVVMFAADLAATLSFTLMTDLRRTGMTEVSPSLRASRHS